MSMQCMIRGCPRAGCILCELDRERFCLIHFYGSKHAQDESSPFLKVYNKAAYVKQKSSAKQLILNLVDEIEDDLLGEIQRTKPKVVNKKVEKKVEKNMSKKKSGKKRRVSEPDSSTKGASFLNNEREIEELYEWQLRTKYKKMKGNGFGGGLSEKVATTTTASTNKSASSIVPKKALVKKKKSWVLAGDELSGQENIPQEAWRRHAAELLANAFRQDCNLDHKDIGKKSLELELAVFKETMVKEDKNDRAAYGKTMRSLLHNLRIEGNSVLRERVMLEQVAVEELLQMEPEKLMDPETARRWEADKALLFEQHRVQDPQDAMASRRIVDNIECVQCGNKTENIVMVLSTQRQSTKSEVW
eukprot:CAMPEP_0203758680 /NCGR_PEP_ID=MMETSP0098-20131031/11519_1 /ASSEMBLY_ACC=CAM_ASM_000208 /TAXON_ID=96639 /ORGANISM=" , Strain NY0313808BC1" /LENGTH=359 /DNA_ID=CAMNT_0050651223 /DNA_START=419 /DNA_END=1495 /DNA_ORIENTATION=+